MLPNNIKILILIFGFFGGTKASPMEALYQPLNSISTSQSEIAFWNAKVHSSTSGYVHLPQLAAVKQATFGMNGDIQLLKEAEQHLIDALNLPAKNKVPMFCALASNYISQHRFCDALDVMNEANTYNHDRRMIDLLLFDVYLELGWEKEAEHQLNTIGLDRNFDYLIRRAKWEDGNGRLDLAVRYLERARSLAERSKQPSHLAWIYSNLGDFYGHQGNLDASESSFKKALMLNPSDAHSFKGLAWIQYSKHGNVMEAINMIEQILTIKKSPDLLLLKSEMYRTIGMNEKANELELGAFNLMTDQRYGRMYQIPIAQHLARNGQLEKAIDLMKNEIEERPTPEVFAATAHVLWMSDKKTSALEIATKKVLGKTVEPKALLNILPIVIDTSLKGEVIDELAETRFELGPVLYERYKSFVDA